jgi:hypothetical protein
MRSASASQRCTSPAIVASSRWRPDPLTAPGSAWPISAANKLTSASADADAVLRDRLARSRVAACDDAVFADRCTAPLRGALREAVAGLVASGSWVGPVAGLAAAAAGATVGTATPDAAAAAAAGASSAGSDSSMATDGAASAITSGALTAPKDADPFVHEGDGRWHLAGQGRAGRLMRSGTALSGNWTSLESIRSSLPPQL